MIDLTSIGQLSFPVTRLKIPSLYSIKSLKYNKISIEGKIIDAGDINGCTYVPEKSTDLVVIKNEQELLGIKNTGRLAHILFIDFKQKKIFKANRNILIKISYKVITDITDEFIRVDTIPHPLRHSDPTLYEYDINHIMLYAKIGFIDRKIYYISTHYNKGEPYNVRI